MKTTFQSSPRFWIILFFLAGSLLFTINTECQPVKVDLRKLPEKRTLKLSELGVADVQYIPLETSPECMIKSIRNVIFGKDFFLIQYFADINMFRYDGSFVTKIGTIGRGPNEFTNAHDADINPKTGSIYVADGFQQKFIVFNKSGKVIRTFKTPLTGALNFKFTDDGILCYYANHMGIVENSFILIDTLGNIIKNFPNKYPWKRTVPNVIFLGENIFYRFNGNLLKKEIYTDTVYAYRNKSFTPNLIIDVGKLRLTPEIREKNDAKFIMNNFLTPMNLFEFGNYIYYEIVIPWEGKTEGLSWIGSKDGKFSVLFDPEIDLINDFDAGPNIWPKTVKENSTLVSWIDAIKLKQYVISTDYMTLKPLNSEKKKQFEKLAQSIDESDNPIIMLIKVK
jgi:hypothetical protein